MLRIQVEVSPSDALEAIATRMIPFRDSLPKVGDHNELFKHYLEWLEDSLVNGHEDFDDINNYKVTAAPHRIKWGTEDSFVEFMPSTAIFTINQAVKEYYPGVWETRAVDTLLNQYGNTIDAMFSAEPVPA